MSELYENRELSWLRFNERVLEEAEDKRNPLCERLTFMSIYQTNLDEFFMVRVGSLHDQMLLEDNPKENKTHMTSSEQLEAIRERVGELGIRKDESYHKLMKEVEKKGIKLVSFAEVDEKESAFLHGFFEREILPLLSPYTISKKSPIPFIKNREICAVAVLETKGGKNRFGIVPCNNGMFARLVPIPGVGGRYILAEELILHFITEVFTGYTISCKSLIRVTRNADIDADKVYDEELNYRDHMAEVIKLRRKLEPVRLEYTRDIDKKIIKNIAESFKIDKDMIFKTSAPLDMSFLFDFQDALRHDKSLFFEKRLPQKSPEIDESKPIIPQIIEKDKMLSYPYESIRPFLSMLHEAANDPDVVSIKMTLYRLAKHSKVVEALVEAAENGKEVDVLVELKARFDEENNIGWSRMLEDAGCHVIYGLDGLKVHSKLCLITMKSGKEVKYITQIGTGNYNEKTARLYTDLCLMTADERIGAEAARVFHALSLGGVIKRTEHLLVAPKCLQNKVIDKIDREIQIALDGGEGYVGVKINSLTDKKIIDKLVEASTAGVKVDMVIRGICCLHPGVKGKTDNIRIISIVGRFLEHSRIYIFGKGEREEMFIASADFMTRNTVRRVEVATPLYDPDIRDRVRKYFELQMTDNVKSRILKSDGTYKYVTHRKPLINSQEICYEEAYNAAENR
ncbi:polyphosphate kinase [Lachnospiraceae bacterium]|nr:polyphosphate kinase [Lachnospiraceae bacterium]